MHLVSNLCSDQMTETADFQPILAVAKIARIQFIRPEICDLSESEGAQFTDEGRRLEKTDPGFAGSSDPRGHRFEVRSPGGIQQVRRAHIIEHNRTTAGQRRSDETERSHNGILAEVRG